MPILCLFSDTALTLVGPVGRAITGLTPRVRRDYVFAQYCDLPLRKVLNQGRYKHKQRSSCAHVKQDDKGLYHEGFPGACKCDLKLLGIKRVVTTVPPRPKKRYRHSTSLVNPQPCTIDQDGPIM